MTQSMPSLHPQALWTLNVPTTPRWHVYVCCSCAHVVEGDLGEMPFYVVCEHIAQYQIGHTCGGQRSLCIQHNNVYVPDAPHTDYSLRGDGVIIIQLGRHRQGVSPLWMWNSATLRWTVSPLRKASFDSNSFTI